MNFNLALAIKRLCILQSLLLAFQMENIKDIGTDFSVSVPTSIDYIIFVSLYPAVLSLIVFLCNALASSQPGSKYPE